jgi:hypothetical protein
MDMDIRIHDVSTLKSDVFIMHTSLPLTNFLFRCFHSSTPPLLCFLSFYAPCTPSLLLLVIVNFNSKGREGKVFHLPPACLPPPLPSLWGAVMHARTH